MALMFQPHQIKKEPLLDSPDPVDSKESAVHHSRVFTTDDVGSKRVSLTNPFESDVSPPDHEVANRNDRTSCKTDFNVSRQTLYSHDIDASRQTVTCENLSEMTLHVILPPADIKLELNTELKTEPLHMCPVLHGNDSVTSSDRAQSNDAQNESVHQPTNCTVKQEPGTIQAQTSSSGTNQGPVQNHPVSLKNNLQGNSVQNRPANLKHEQHHQSVENISSHAIIRECRVLLRREIWDTSRPYLREVIGFEPLTAKSKSLLARDLKPSTVSNDFSEEENSVDDAGTSTAGNLSYTEHPPNTVEGTEEANLRGNLDEGCSSYNHRKSKRKSTQKTEENNLNKDSSAVERVRKRTPIKDTFGSEIRRQPKRQKTKMSYTEEKNLIRDTSSVNRVRKTLPIKVRFGSKKRVKEMIRPVHKIKKIRRKRSKASYLANLFSKKRKMEELSVVDEVDENLQVAFVSLPGISDDLQNSLEKASPEDFNLGETVSVAIEHASQDHGMDEPSGFFDCNDSESNTFQTLPDEIVKSKQISEQQLGIDQFAPDEISRKNDCKKLTKAEAFSDQATSNLMPSKKSSAIKSSLRLKNKKMLSDADMSNKTHVAKTTANIDSKRFASKSLACTATNLDNEGSEEKGDSELSIDISLEKNKERISKNSQGFLEVERSFSKGSKKNTESVANENERKELEMKILNQINALENDKIVLTFNDVPNHKCSVCHIKFASSQKLQQHYSSHNVPYKCPLCDETFFRHTALLEHMKTHGEGILKQQARNKKSCVQKCEVCGEVLPDASKLRQHLLAHFRKNSGNWYVCDICRLMISSEEALNKHLQEHDQEIIRQADVAPIKTFDCSSCGLSFSMQATLNCHLKLHKKKVRSASKASATVCFYCGKDLKKVCSLKIHLRIHTGERPFHCSFCETSLFCQSSLNKHMLKHTGIKEHVCDVCGQAFSRRSKLTIHFRKHFPKEEMEVPTLHAVRSKSVLNKQQCPICLKFFHKRFFKEHREKHLNCERIFECTHCDKSFPTRAKQVRHMKIHTQSFQCICEHCGKGFMCKSDLEIHLYRHSDKRLFTCDICGCCLKTPKGLQTHKKNNSCFSKNSLKLQNSNCTVKPAEVMKTTEKIYSKEELAKINKRQCPICNKLVAPGYLSMHKKIHKERKRKYECTKCSLKFIDKKVLAKHQRTHTNYRPFHCTIPHCRKSFFETNDLKKHIERHRKNNPSRFQKSDKSEEPDPSRFQKSLKESEEPDHLDNEKGPLDNHKSQGPLEKVGEQDSSSSPKVIAEKVVTAYPEELIVNLEKIMSIDKLVEVKDSGYNAAPDGAPTLNDGDVNATTPDSAADDASTLEDVDDDNDDGDYKASDDDDDSGDFVLDSGFHGNSKDKTTKKGKIDARLKHEEKTDYSSPQNFPYKCDVCNKRFSSVAILQTHIMAHVSFSPQ